MEPRLQTRSERAGEASGCGCGQENPTRAGAQEGEAAMTIIHCYVDERTMEVLERESRVRGRTVEDLAEAAIAEAALQCLPPHLRKPGHPTGEGG